MATKAVHKNIPISSLVPEPAAEYCIGLIKTYHLKVRIVKPRETILGTYIRKQLNGQILEEEIRINAGLGKQLFLTVFLHEIAHWLVANSPKRQESPHGIAWQETFKRLVEPVLNIDNFSKRQLTTLTNELYGERTSACFSADLLHHLRYTDEEFEETGTIALKSLVIGTIFIHNQKPFQIIEKRRTRALCLQLFEGRNLLVQLSAQVAMPEHSDLLRLHKLSLQYVTLATLNTGELFQYLGETFQVIGPDTSKNGLVKIRKPHNKSIFTLSEIVLVKVVEQEVN
jgi:SprT protein